MVKQEWWQQKGLLMVEQTRQGRMDQLGLMLQMLRMWGKEKLRLVLLRINPRAYTKLSQSMHNQTGVTVRYDQTFSIWRQ